MKQLSSLEELDIRNESGMMILKWGMDFAGADGHWSI